MAIKHFIKNSKGGKVEVRTTPVKAVRLFCLECMCYQIAEIPRCTATLCPLYPYRMGKSHTGRKGNAVSLPHRRSKLAQESTIISQPIPDYT